MRRNSKTKDLEFRLKIDFTEFVSASHERKLELLFEQLHKSVDLMAKWKLSADDREKLHSVLNIVMKSPSVRRAASETT
ncbi:MAG: hypothetical protein JNM66_20275 [Bryobacterales bacterium]|nr:hypothetical protein [Bryobacterales bacterium]